MKRNKNIIIDKIRIGDIVLWTYEKEITVIIVNHIYELKTSSQIKVRGNSMHVCGENNKWVQLRYIFFDSDNLQII